MRRRGSAIVACFRAEASARLNWQVLVVVAFSSFSGVVAGFMVSKAGCAMDCCTVMVTFFADGL
jgi:hypothetical protein